MAGVVLVAQLAPEHGPQVVGLGGPEEAGLGAVAHERARPPTRTGRRPEAAGASPRRRAGRARRTAGCPWGWRSRPTSRSGLTDPRGRALAVGAIQGQGQGEHGLGPVEPVDAREQRVERAGRRRRSPGPGRRPARWRSRRGWRPRRARPGTARGRIHRPGARLVLEPQVSGHQGLGIEAQEGAAQLAGEALAQAFDSGQQEAVHAVRRIAIAVGVAPAARAPSSRWSRGPVGEALALPLPLHPVVLRRACLVGARGLEPGRVPRGRAPRPHVAVGPERRAHGRHRHLHHQPDLTAPALLHEPQEQAVGRRPLPGGRVGGVLGGPHQTVALGIGPEVVVHVVQEGGIALQGRRGLEHRAQQEPVHPQAVRWSSFSMTPARSPP